MVNFRTRIAKSEKQVTKATGIASLREVEDNQIKLLYLHVEIRKKQLVNKVKHNL